MFCKRHETNQKRRPIGMPSKIIRAFFGLKLTTHVLFSNIFVWFWHDASNSAGGNAKTSQQPWIVSV